MSFPWTSYEKEENMVCFVQPEALVYKLLSAVFAGNCTKAVTNILSKHRVWQSDTKSQYACVGGKQKHMVKVGWS